MTTPRTLRGLALITLPLAALLLSGCAGQQPEPEAAGAGQQDDMHSWLVKHAECMQGEGIDYPTPNADPNAAMQAIDIEELGGIDVFEAADKTCMGKIGEPPAPTDADGNPMTEEDMMEQTLKLTTCLREQGVDVADPTPGGGITIPEGAPDAAFEACGMGGVPASGE